MTSRCTPEGNVLGHAWEPIPVTKRAPFGVYLWLRCTRGCGTERHDIVDRFSGKLLSRKMIHSDNQPREKLTMDDKRKLLITERIKKERTERRTRKEANLPY